MRRSVLGATVWGVVASSALVVFGRPIVRAWAGGSVVPELSLLLPLGLFGLFLCVSHALVVYMNAANVIGFQAACLSVMVALNLTLSIVLTHAIGVSGPAWGSAISLALVVIVPYAFYVKASMARLSRLRLGPAPIDNVSPADPLNP
jgi:O-antigen/teichoic acid export membrane protein